MTKNIFKVTIVILLIVTIALAAVSLITFDSDTSNENWVSFITTILAISSSVAFLFMSLYYLSIKTEFKSETDV